MNQQESELIEEIAADAQRRDPRNPLRRWFLADPHATPSVFLQKVGEALREAKRDVIHFQLPSGHLDAGEHLLGQLCQGVDVDRLRPAAFSPSYPIHKRISWISQWLGASPSAPVLLLSIPDSWLGPIWDERRALPDTSRNILEALLGHIGFDAVVVSTRRAPWLRKLLRAYPMSLREPPAGVGFLADERRWGGASDAAHRLAKDLGARAHAMPARVLKLGVAWSVLGFSGSELARALTERGAAESLRAMMRREPTWQLFLRRLTTPRFPVPRALLDDLAGPKSDQQRAFADAVIHEDHGEAKADDLVRRLCDIESREPDTQTHERLAEHFRALDGVSDAEKAIRAQRVVPWLERVHHLGHAGRSGIEALREITPLSRMSRYELAWSLSYELKEYELAAEVYRALATERPDDAYSHHYWAWNLDQEGREFETVRREYEQALRIDPENPWYNSRYITFLRDNGFQQESREAWRDALPIVSASRWAAMPDFADQFHRWVARSALDAGDLVLASEVLGTLPRAEVEQNAKLAPLLAELDYLLDIDRLGEAIYPLGAPTAKRWKDHYLVPEGIEIPGRTDKARLLAFYPGRVAAIDDGVVTLVLADPKPDPPALFTLEMSEAELRECGGGEAPQVGRFLELGHYEGDVTRVRYHRSAQELDRKSFDRSLRHLQNPVSRKGT